MSAEFTLEVLLKKEAEIKNLTNKLEEEKKENEVKLQEQIKRLEKAKKDDSNLQSTIIALGEVVASQIVQIQKFLEDQKEKEAKIQELTKKMEDMAAELEREKKREVVQIITSNPAAEEKIRLEQLKVRAEWRSRRLEEIAEEERNKTQNIQYGVCSGIIEGNEEVLFHLNCRFYRLQLENREWTDCRDADIRILKNIKDGSYRVDLQDHTKKVLVNFKLYKGMYLKKPDVCHCAWTCNNTTSGVSKMEAFIVLLRSDDFMRIFLEGANNTTAIIPIEFKPAESEGEIVVFENKCELFRFSGETQKWLESESGIIQIFKNLEGNSYRVLMRQEKTQNIRANFKLTSGMFTDPKPHQIKRDCWWHCNDFSDEEAPRMERFTARFESTELVKEFVKAFKEGVAIAEAYQIISENHQGNSKIVFSIE